MIILNAEFERQENFIRQSIISSFINLNSSNTEHFALLINILYFVSLCADFILIHILLLARASNSCYIYLLSDMDGYDSIK